MVGWPVPPPFRFLSIRIRWSAALSLAALLAETLELEAQPVGSEFQVNTYTVSTQWFPAVAAGGNGDFTVVWESNGQDGHGTAVFGQRYASTGGAIGGEFQVNINTLFNQGRPEVAADADGNFVVVYENAGNSSARRFSSAGAGVGTEFQVSTYTLGEQRSPDVATDAAGNFVVVWQSLNQEAINNNGVSARRYASSGAIVGNEFQVNTYTIGSQNSPAVASDADGDIVFVWQSGQDGGTFGGIFGQRYASAGNTIGSEFQINTFTIGSQYGPAVAADGDGNFVAVWRSDLQDGDGTGIFGQRYASDGAPAGSEFQVNSYTLTDQYRPAVTAESDGDFTVIWGSFAGQDGSHAGVFGQRYTSSGAAIGSEFQVNTYTGDEQAFPAVAAQSDEGHFVVAWRSLQPDGFYTDIFAQRYGATSGCPAAPDPGCTTGFAKGLLIVKELAGKEKVIAKLLNGPATAQGDFGDPTIPGGTGYTLCIYDDASNLVAGLDVDRAGDATCSGGATQCWKAIGGVPPGGKGYKYKDKSLAADGLLLVLLKGGESGKVKIVVKGMGANLPLPIAGSLTSAGSVTLQLRGSDAPQCFSVTLSEVKKQEADFFKAK